MLLKKTVFPVRQKGVPPLLLPASMLQLPRCLARIYNLDFHDLTLFELDSFKRCNCSRKSNSQKSNLLRKCGLLAHTSPAFLKNCWIKKLFSCLRLGIGNLTSRNTTQIRLGKAGAHPQLALGIAIAPETFVSHYNLLILKAIAILSMLS